MKSTRAFSLLEMLLVLALLAALSALVLPALGGRVADATATAAGRSLLAAAATARARAIASGRAVALIEVKGPTGAARLYGDVVSGAPSEGGADDAALELSEQAELLTELPRDCRVRLDPPAAQTGAGSTDEAGVSPEPLPSSTSVSRLAVFLPDGSAVRPAPLYLLTRGGAAFRCDLGICTGRATLAAIETEDPVGAEEGPDAEPPPPIEPEGGDAL